jgi:hypothetical protein
MLSNDTVVIYGSKVWQTFTQSLFTLMKTSYDAHYRSIAQRPSTHQPSCRTGIKKKTNSTSPNRGLMKLLNSSRDVTWCSFKSLWTNNQRRSFRKLTSMRGKRSFPMRYPNARTSDRVTKVKMVGSTSEHGRCEAKNRYDSGYHSLGEIECLILFYGHTFNSCYRYLATL